MNLKSIAILAAIVLILGVASYSFPTSFALSSGAPVKPHSQGAPVNQNQTQRQNQGEQGPSAADGGNGFGTSGVKRQQIQQGNQGEQGPSGTTNDPTGFGANNVKQNQIQKGNQGTQGQKCLGPIISVSTPSATNNYIWIDNMGPWRNWVSNWHVTAGSHYITIDRYSYDTGNLIQHLVRVGYTDNCHTFTFKMS